jgi:threonine dehydrogenase-like Zn-dependent dehydrogenase
MRALRWHGKHDIRCDHVPDPVMSMGALMNKGLTLRTGKTHVNRWTQDLLGRIEQGQIDHRSSSLTPSIWSKGRRCTARFATNKTAASRS